ncbi:hypothetical protein F4779DRAFT_619866 [Xylariaceae sp. FL0662B]|nr:hypothetical protein F4779DRAFT_619866 [Xylariaceae sp. FL0662B]
MTNLSASKPSSDHLIELMKQCECFDDLPDELSVASERKVFLYRSNPSVDTSKADADIRGYEDYLRSKWECTEALPEGFDPEKLEAARDTRFKSRDGTDDAIQANDKLRSGDEDVHEDVHETDDEAPSALGDEHRHTDIYPSQANSSSDSVMTDISITESLDTEEELKGYENEVTVHKVSRESITRVCSHTSMINAISPSAADPIELKPTPRIRTGSKPPLSKSAFVVTYGFNELVDEHQF